MAPAFTAASVTSTSMESSKIWRLGWNQEQWILGVHWAPPDSGWARGWSQDASPAREAPASRVTATQQGIVVSPAPATRAGQGHCVTSKSTTLVMATSKCFTVSIMCGLVSTKLDQPLQVLFRILLLGDLFIHNHLHLSCLSILRCIHGTCIPINSYSYSCRCQPGFSGVLCDEQDQDTTNPCSLSRCKHGKCRVSGLGKAYCECYSGYTGEACDRGEKNGSVSLCVTYYLCHCKHFFFLNHHLKLFELLILWLLSAGCPSCFFAVC